NPVQQLARTRDAGRISTVSQLGHALEAFGTNNSGNYVAEGATWVTALVTAGEINSAPGVVAYSAPASPAACTENAQNGFCYDASSVAGGAPAVVYTSLESQSQNSKCTGATPVAFAVYSTAQGQAGVVCGTAAGGLNPGNLTFLP
nr:hypothetical protein [Patescibacteria group bacterium]